MEKANKNEEYFKKVGVIRQKILQDDFRLVSIMSGILACISFYYLKPLDTYYLLLCIATITMGAIIILLISKSEYKSLATTGRIPWVSFKKWYLNLISPIAFFILSGMCFIVASASYQI